MMTKSFRNILLILLLVAGSAPCYALAKPDTAGPAKTILTFTCTSTSSDTIILKSQISVRHDDWNTNLMNALVIFSVGGKDAFTTIGQVKTGTNGEAILKISAKQMYFRNPQGMIGFKAEYAGDAKYEASAGESGLKPGKLIISFYEADSLKYVKVIASQLEADGKEKPLGGQTVLIYVPRMLSLLKIAEITLDSLGEGTAEFPRDIIGDAVGHLTVIAQIEENDIYGNIRAESKTGWGLPKHLIKAEQPSRELWTPIAPLWMIITLIIMLAGVWGHYTYTIVQLFMIKKKALPREPDFINTKASEPEIQEGKASTK
jgi:hypothetical protein